MPGPSSPFSAQELVMMRRMVRERLRRAEKRAKTSEARGFEAGRNTNIVHARRLREMDDKVVAWLTEAWPIVAAATGEDEATGLADWLQASLSDAESLRLGSE